MGAPYQESYGDDRVTPPGYWDEVDDETVWRYGDRHGNVWYDWVDHMWKCKCRVYITQGVCKHAYRYRRQDTIAVREEYL